MLCALRRTRLASLLALFIITGSVPISTAALLHDASDDACQPTFVQHDESAHRLGAARTATSVPQHCAICHWLQSLQTMVATVGMVAPDARSHHFAASFVSAASAAAIGQLSARAPPRSL
jgi:hypothetical protein